LALWQPRIKPRHVCSNASISSAQPVNYNFPILWRK
jgi:hypothetical protein